VVTVVVLFRNAPRLARNCLRALRGSVGTTVEEVLLIDDCSEPGRDVLPLLTSFRAELATATPRTAVRIVRFRRPMHYGLGLAYALSIARRDTAVLFLSHDMMLTPACLRAMTAVIAADREVGIVRPSSQHMDWAKPLTIAPPAPIETFEAASAFADDVYKQFINGAFEWPMLIGDAMQIRRAVIDRIGVFDPQFPTYMGDIDYGIRAARAGFRHVIARGAWLHHEGNGTAKETATAGGESVLQQGRRMLAMVEESYARFRQKWGEANFPPHFRDMRRQHFEALHALPGRLSGDAFVPQLTMSDDIGEMIE